MIRQFNSATYTWMVFTICILAYGSLEMRDNWIRNNQNEYGLSYNAERERLGIPIIPEKWHVKQREKESIWWTGNENVIGHKRKMVIFSGSNINGELDVFRLPVQNREERLLEIAFSYPQGNEEASFTYTYQVGHSAKLISKMTADSILTSELADDE